MDTVQLRSIVRLRNLLTNPEIKPRLRSGHVGHRVSVQGHRGQRRDHLRIPLLRRGTRPERERARAELVTAALGGDPGGRNPMLFGLHHDVGFGDNVVSSCKSVDIHPDDDEVQSKSGSEDMLDLGAELNLFQAMRTVNFWLLFVAMICGMGSGLATINNISQIGQSLGYSTVERSTLVSLWSIWNFLGRFGAGYASDIFLHRRGWARPLLMALTLAAMTAGHVVIASGFSGNLFIGSVLVGVCYGSQWSLMPTITSEIFGVRHLGTIFNTIAVASPIGSYVLSVRVIGYIYDRHATGEENTCYGKYCFMSSFFILASVTVLGFLVALALFFRTRRFYSQLLVRWLRHTAIELDSSVSGIGQESLVFVEFYSGIGVNNIRS
nr:protein NUCLEAR FUSION DEFECTIVE 4-like [Coffea arabica]